MTFQRARDDKPPLCHPGPRAGVHSSYDSRSASCTAPDAAHVPGVALVTKKSLKLLHEKIHRQFASNSSHNAVLNHCGIESLRIWSSTPPVTSATQTRWSLELSKT